MSGKGDGSSASSVDRLRRNFSCYDGFLVVVLFFVFLRSPAISLGFTTFGVGFLRM